MAGALVLRSLAVSAVASSEGWSEEGDQRRRKMKHGIKKRKLGRVKKQRTALLRSLTLSLIEHEQIKTTEAKAKEMRPFVEKLITRGKNPSVYSRRILSARLGGNKIIVKKLVDEVAPRYKDRAGGYTRITKLPNRKSDASPMAIIELIE